MKDHSFQGYLERLSTEKLKYILNEVPPSQIANYEQVREMIIKILEKREQ